MRSNRNRTRLVACMLAAFAIVPLGAGVADAKKKKKPVPVEVMTRNIFLGADLSPALNAANNEEFIEANGAILREVDQTDFTRRSAGLAREIEEFEPDLIGLQEAAWWRTGNQFNVAQGPGGNFTATTTKYDFLQMLRTELQARGLNYDIAVEKVEFDFEAPADYNDADNDGLVNEDPTTNDETPNSVDDAELTGRLTMRDVILVNADSKLKLKLRNPESGTYQNLYTPTVAGGVEVPVTRGWTSVDVKAKKGKGKKTRKAQFKFVNTHLEAFDDETQNPSIRAQQATELVNGPASDPRTILLGDFNSDTDTEVQPGDAQAFQVILNAGFDRRATSNPLSCCVSNLFTSPPSEFDHQVDHIVTNMGRKAKLAKSTVTGLTQVNGIYNSDHAGIVSKLKVKK